MRTLEFSDKFQETPGASYKVAYTKTKNNQPPWVLNRAPLWFLVTYL